MSTLNAIYSIYARYKGGTVLAELGFLSIEKSEDGY